ncbi:DMT family transporter [uncultured Abyssibacter sp.]|uniref:DMT family transporter n=1 Tax=uncultured Abyssibacter sp. TaxID=2320202 RepID=UPI0032B28EA8
MSPESSRWPLAGLIVGALCIGLAPIFVRLTEVGPTSAAFWRLALASPLLLLAWSQSPERLHWRLLWPGLLFAGDLAVWHQSIHITSVANATLLANLQPAIVAAISVLFLGVRLSRGFVLGLALAMSGAIILMADSLSVSLEHFGGDLLGVLTACFYAGYILTVAAARRSHHVVSVMAAATLVGAVVLAPIALASGEAFWPTSRSDWLMLGGLALISHIGGQGLIAWSLRHLSTQFSSVSLLIQPVAAAVFAWLLLAEPFGAWQALGGAIVLGGILICRQSTPAGQASANRSASA